MSHIHSYELEPANGPVSVGRCECGHTKEHRNSLPVDQLSSGWKKKYGGEHQNALARHIRDELRVLD